jgi:epsin
LGNTVIESIDNPLSPLFHHTPVRNRAKELAELLSDVDKIKAERKKAKHNRNKYTAVSSSSAGGGGGYSGGGSSRYGGFGSESGYTAGGSGNGGFSASGGYSGSGGFGGGYDDDFSDSYGKGKYDDDGSFEDDDSSDKSKTKAANSDTNSAVSPKPAKQLVKELNLFDFDEPTTTTTHTSTQPTSNLADDDEWGTFSSGGVANGKG